MRQQANFIKTLILCGRRYSTGCGSKMDKFVTRTKRPEGTTDTLQQADSGAKSTTVTASETESGSASTINDSDSDSSLEFVEKRGDLFGCPASDSLAHCISADVCMGKGIAVLFKKKFGGVQELLAQGQRAGGVATLERDGRYIYYLITKEKFNHKPTYDTLHKSLKAMHRHCMDYGVGELSMPKIGCGLDGLKWYKVVNIIKDVFKETGMTITAYTMEQADSGAKLTTVTASETESASISDSDISDSDLVKAACLAESTASKSLEFVEKRGDLFGCPASNSLAHCISADVCMGKGIAVLFKKKFGGVRELVAQGQRAGGVATLKRDGRYIYYLITKEKFHHKPTYGTLHKSLKAMRKHCMDNGVGELSMPKIGCGLDGLKWYKVVDIIKDVFKESGMTITAYTVGA